MGILQRKKRRVPGNILLRRQQLRFEKPILVKNFKSHYMGQQKKKSMTRRDFLGNTIKATIGTTAAMSLPSIVPASVFGKYAPSNRINVGAIGVGRISRGHDLPGVWQYDTAQVMAV